MTDWRREPKTWAAIAVTLLLWASAFAGIKAGMRLTPAGVPGPDGYGPGEVALLRFGVASHRARGLRAVHPHAPACPRGPGAHRVGRASSASRCITWRSTSARCG